MKLQTMVIRPGRIIAITPMFRERCSSFLNYANVVGRVSEWGIRDEEWDVVNFLLRTRKLREFEASDRTVYFIANYAPLVRTEGAIDPTVLSLADENPANANFVRVYRKNA